MPSFIKFNQFVQDLGRGVHNLNADTFKVMLTNVAPSTDNTVKGEISEIGAGGYGYAAGGAVAASPSFTQTAGVGKFVAGDVSWTASAGQIGPWRYAVLYNDTSPSDSLLGFWDYGSSITTLAGDVIIIDFDQVNGIFTIT